MSLKRKASKSNRMKILSYTAALFLISLNVQALPQDSRVPGGIAVIPLIKSDRAPKVTFNKETVLVTRKSAQEPWQAWLGIPLKQPVGEATFEVNGQPKSISIGHYDYPEQRLQVKNKHVNPNKEQLERISREFVQDRKSVV